MDLLDSRREADVLHLTLRGAWGAASIPAIRLQQRALDLAGVRHARITVATEALDLAGAWTLDALTSELIMPIAVDLPAPLGPSKAKKSPSSTSRLMPFKASKPLL